MSMGPEISCPPIRSQLSAYPDLPVSAGNPRFGFAQIRAYPLRLLIEKRSPIVGGGQRCEANP